jgi:hypothetical protein
MTATSPLTPHSHPPAHNLFSTRVSCAGCRLWQTDLTSHGDAEITCVALYPFAAINKTHLNAQGGERFRVINNSFDWWLCQVSFPSRRTHRRFAAVLSCCISHVLAFTAMQSCSAASHARLLLSLRC